MVLADALVEARACYGRQAWREAYDLLSRASGEVPLGAEDLDRLAGCAYMLGNEAEAADLWARAHHEFLACGDAEQASRCAFRIAFELLNRGQTAHGSGWLARARRVLDDAGLDCAMRGYLLMPEGIRIARGGDPSHGFEVFCEAEAIGRRFGDTDLVAFGRLGQGRALIRMGKVAEGTALLDEVMVGVTAGELQALRVGDIYCSVIDACTEIFDLRRAHEWTAALHRWCEGQPDQISYRGTCLIRRAEILQIHGLWSEAMDEVERACERLLLPPPKPAAGLAHYQRGELHRLRGEFDKAEEAYRQASALGRKPQPGLALLRLAKGDADAALASIRRVVEETRDPAVRCRVLGAFVEILLATNDIAGARQASQELSAFASALEAPFLAAAAAQCEGMVHLAEGDAVAALEALERALEIWREIEAPYEEARTRVLIAVASRTVGDDDTADLELDAARGLFETLGAIGEMARVEKLAGRSGSKGSSGATSPLTARELEVLSLVATGKTNRAIADALRLSEKTVARHISNIFTKLGLSNRAAATAYAYRKGLV
jgi:DNA-binding CsgD family transcriptional regulator